MTELTEATAVTPEDLARWYAMQEQIRNLKAAEAMLRSRIYKHYFTDPTDGTNTRELGDGTGAVLKATRKVERRVSEADLDGYKTTCKEEGSNLPKLPWNKLIAYKPELVKAEYNRLTDEERAACDLVLVIKEGSPSLEIVIPKKRVG